MSIFAHPPRAGCRPAALLASTVTALLVLAPSALAKTWSNESLPKGLGILDAISCRSHKGHEHCVAVGQDAKGGPAVVLSNDGGKTWKLGAAPFGLSAMVDVSCETAGDCWAAAVRAGKNATGAVEATTDGGRSWRAQRVPKGIPGLTWLSCRGRACIAGALNAGNGLLVSSDRGATWSSRTLPLPQGCTSSCPAENADKGALASTSAGYAVGGSPCNHSHGTACPGVIWRTADGGNSWRIVFDKKPIVDAISCIGPDRCWAAAATFKTGVMLTTANGGKSWSQQTLPKFGGYFNDISCGRVSKHNHCVAVGQNQQTTAPVIAYTSNGGGKWQLEHAPAGTGALFGSELRSDGVWAVGFNPQQNGARAIER